MLEFKQLVFAQSIIYAIQFYIIMIMLCTFKKKTVINYILSFVLVVLLYIIIIFGSYGNPVEFQVVLIMETFGAIGIFMIFTQGKLFYNLIKLTLVLKVVSIVVLLLGMVIYPLQIASTTLTNESSFTIQEAVIAIIINMLLAIICGCVFGHVFPAEIKGSDRVFRIAYLGFFAIGVISYNTKDRVPGMLSDDRNTQKLVFVIYTLALTVIGGNAAAMIYNYMEKKRIEKEKQAINVLVDEMYVNYQQIVNDNKELKELKHDINKHIQLLEAMSETSENEEKIYIRQMLSDLKLARIPLSGNQYIDTILAMKYDKAVNEGIMFEAVVEPLADTTSVEDSKNWFTKEELINFFTTLMDEAISDSKINNTCLPWIRVSIRNIGRNKLIKIECSIEEKSYKLRRMMKMLLPGIRSVWRSEKVVKHLVAEHNGSYISNLDSEMKSITVVI